MKDKVLIVTPTHKRPIAIIKRCLDSVYGQSVDTIIHVVCTDGESDTQLEELVKEYQNKAERHNREIQFVYMYTGIWFNDHANSVRNFVVESCKDNSEISHLVFLDDDNVILPHYIESKFNALSNAQAQNSKVKFCVSRIIHFGPLPAKFRPPAVLTGIPVQVENIDSLQVMVAIEAFIENGMWHTEYGYMADGYTYQALAQRYSYVVMDEILSIHF